MTYFWYLLSFLESFYWPFDGNFLESSQNHNKNCDAIIQSKTYHSFELKTFSHKQSLIG